MANSFFGTQGGFSRSVEAVEKQRQEQAQTAALAPPKPEDAIAAQAPKYNAVGNSFFNAMGVAGNNYLNSSQKTYDEYLKNNSSNEDKYQTDLNSLMDQSRQQTADTTKVYNQTILPNAMSALDRASTEAKSAMTLQQAQDPNNPVAAGFRQFYEDQAQGEGRRGRADTGILQAMGAQALNSQISSGVPMTGGQMQALMGQNMSQAGQAYANVQRRMQNLRDQGLQEGWNQTDMAYQRGERAQDRWRQSTSDLQNVQGTNIQQQGWLRGEQGGYSGSILGSRNRVNDANTNVGLMKAQDQRDYDSGLGSLRYQLDTGSLDRTSALEAMKFGRDTSKDLAKMQVDSAQSISDARSRDALIGAIFGAGGRAVGAA